VAFVSSSWRDYRERENETHKSRRESHVRGAAWSSCSRDGEFSIKGGLSAVTPLGVRLTHCPRLHSARAPDTSGSTRRTDVPLGECIGRTRILVVTRGRTCAREREHALCAYARIRGATFALFITPRGTHGALRAVAPPLRGRKVGPRHPLDVLDAQPFLGSFRARNPSYRYFSGEHFNIAAGTMRP